MPTQSVSFGRTLCTVVRKRKVIFQVKDEPLKNSFQHQNNLNIAILLNRAFSAKLWLPSGVCIFYDILK